MKRQIMASLQSQKEASYEIAFAKFIEKIRNLASETFPSILFQSVLKEKLMTVVEFHTKRFSFVPMWMRDHRRLFSGVLAVVFVFGVLFNYTFNIQHVEASFLTSLEEVSGEVMVIRDSQTIRGEAHLLLKADDTIITGKNSKAIIQFLDQSVSRLDENTEVKISTLFVNPLNKTETVVELVLSRGRLWSRVISLIDNLSRFQVKAKNTVTVAKKRAAFDISVSSKGKAKVSAVQNRVDLVVATDKKVVETTLMKGFTAEVKTDTPLAPQIRSEQGVEQKDDWVVDNLAQDKIYIESVKQENQAQLSDQVQVLPGSPFYAMKEISEGTKIALTIGDFERQGKLLRVAQEKFAEAQLLFVQGNAEKAQTLLQEFQSLVQDLLTWVKDSEAKNPVQALALRAQIKEALNGYEKQFVLLFPIDPLYALKESIGRTQLLIATNSEQKTQELISQAGDKLLEAHDLVEQGETEAAKDQVEAYSKALFDVVEEVKQLPTDEKEKAVTALLDNKAEDLKVLEAIVAIPFPGSTTSPAENFSVGSTTKTDDLKKTVSEARTEALTQLGEAVLDVQKTQPSTEVLKKLEDINKIGVNGKSVVDLRLTKDRVYIKSDGTMISVSGSTTPLIPTPPTPDLEIPESPQAQP